MVLPAIKLTNNDGNGEDIIDLRYTSKSVTSNEFTVDELKQNYLFGLDLSDSNGNPFPEGLIIHHLNSAIAYLERALGIQINESEETERHDFHQGDYINWGYIQLFKCPVISIEKLCLTYGEHESMIIPTDWIQLNKISGQITLFPSHGSAGSLIIGRTGNLFGIQSRFSYAPQMWKVVYKAGISDIPADLYEAVYKKASIGIMQVWGDLILGAGIASQSISFDGISQSIGTTQSAMYGGASARCVEYRKDLAEMLIPALKAYYTGIKMTVL